MTSVPVKSLVSTIAPALASDFSFPYSYKEVAMS